MRKKVDALRKGLLLETEKRQELLDQAAEIEQKQAKVDKARINTEQRVARSLESGSRSPRSR